MTHTHQDPSHRLRDLLARMTLDEKLAQLTSYWFNDLQTGQQPSLPKMQALLKHGIGQVSRLGGSSTLPPQEVARAGNQIQRFLVEHTRLGIPAILHEECCLGYLGLGGTIYPQIIGLASAWSPALVEQVTTQIRAQMLAVGARQGLSPVLDLAVDPRWGRTEETFGEDPYLASQLGMAYVRGVQGEDWEHGLMATGKHFVGHSLSLGGLNCAPAQVGPRALWDTFLVPFQAAIQKAGLRSIMNAYPELDGEVVAASRRILTGLLRDQLGFEGLVVSDYHAILMIHTFHRAAADRSTAARLALQAGIDVELPTCNCYGAPLREALEAGQCSLEEVDAAVWRVLQAKIALGLLDNPYVDEGAVMASFETPAQRQLARQAACQSMVLLKNDGLLPLRKTGVIALIGPNAAEPRHLIGDYSYPGMFELMTRAPMEGSAFITGVDPASLRGDAVRVPSVLEGLQAHLGDQAQVLYARGCHLTDPDRSGFDEALQIAARADVIILVLGDKSGLVPDCTCGETRDRADLGLPGVQEELARAVSALGKPVVVVLVNGRPLAIPWLDEHASAILEAWLPGEEGAAALAEILFGDANPGGRLPITFPRSVGQLPVYYNHKPTGNSSYWYVDYVETPAAPLYPFGHGLTYTTFAYSDLRISTASATQDEVIDISLAVTNSGSRPGTEVVQLYVCDEYASIPRPLKELKGFASLSLAPGESRRLAFHLPVDLLAFHDENLRLILEPGPVRVMLGASSADIRLEATIEISGAGKMPVAERLFTCPVTLATPNSPP